MDDYKCKLDLTLNGAGVKWSNNSQKVDFVTNLKYYLFKEHLVESNSSFDFTGSPIVNKYDEPLNDDEVRFIFKLEIKSRTAFEGD